MKHVLTAILTGAALLSLPGCAVTKSAIDPHATVSPTRSLKDVNAVRAIKARMYRADNFDLNDVTVDVINGVVVLSGTAPSPEDKVEAERIAWSAPGITQVGNEIRLGRALGFGKKAKDDAISTAVRTKLAASSEVRNLNYSIETVGGTVYLMGVARNEFELAEAARIASVTRGVKEVISYVTIAGEMPNSFDSAPTSSVVAQRSLSAPDPDDLSYWGTPVPSSPALPTGPIADTPPPSSGGAIPYSAPIDPEAPLPYRPGSTELDPDALDSGEPIYRDPVTGERIFLPPGTQVIPYRPDEGPGSLGHGGTPPPGLASAGGYASVQSASTVQAILPDQTVRILTLTPQTRPAAAPVTIQTPAVRWDGEKWVAAQ